MLSSLGSSWNPIIKWVWFSSHFELSCEKLFRPTRGLFLTFDIFGINWNDHASRRCELFSERQLNEMKCSRRNDCRLHDFFSLRSLSFLSVPRGLFSLLWKGKNKIAEFFNDTRRERIEGLERYATDVGGCRWCSALFVMSNAMEAVAITIDSNWFGIELESFATRNVERDLFPFPRSIVIKSPFLIEKCDKGKRTSVHTFV